MIKVNQLHYVLLIKYLTENESTVYELADEIGLHIRTCRELVNLFKKHKLIHICNWDKDKAGKVKIPVYKFGDGKNKAKVRKSAVERNREYRARLKIKSIPLSTLQPDHGSKPIPHPHQ